MTFDVLNGQLNTDQRAMLTAIWDYWVSRKTWMPCRVLHHGFPSLKKPGVRSALKALGGTVVYEAGFGDSETYQLTGLGVLLGARGRRAEDLLVRYLDYARRRFTDDPELVRLTSEEVETALGLTAKDSTELYQLLHLFRLWGGTTSGGYGQPWIVALPPDVEDLPSDLLSYVRGLAIRNFDPNYPIEEGGRTLYDASGTRGLVYSGSEQSTVVEDETEPALSEKFRVFVSHGAADAAIAVLLKADILRRVPDVEVFSSSDPTDLPPGSKWSEKIQRALARANLLVLIATDRGLSRRWVWFEVGSMWFGQRPVIPLCVGSIRKGKLPAPLSERQALDAGDRDDLELFFREVGRLAGRVAQDLEVVPLMRELERLDGKICDNQSAAGSSKEEVYPTREGRTWRREDIDKLPEAELRKLRDEKPDLLDWWLGKPI